MRRWIRPALAAMISLSSLAVPATGVASNCSAIAVLDTIRESNTGEPLFVVARADGGCSGQAALHLVCLSGPGAFGCNVGATYNHVGLSAVIMFPCPTPLQQDRYYSVGATVFNLESVGDSARDEIDAEPHTSGSRAC